jgi:hypothetical protein
LRTAQFDAHIGMGARRTLSNGKILLFLSLGLLLVAPLFVSMPKAQAAVTINNGLGIGSGTASAFGNQRAVYYVQYVASPLSYGWWAFYSTTTGIEYQSSTNGVTWTAQGTLTSSGDYSYGGAFSGYLSGSNLYYAVASASGNILYYGEVTLAVSGTPTVVTSGSLTTTNAMTATSTTSITVDANGYTWVSVATAGTVEVWACKSVTLAGCTWEAQGSVSGSSTFALANGSPSSELLNLGSSVALLFVNPGVASTYGPFDIYYLTSSGTAYVAWTGPESPSSVFYQENYFSAVVSGTTIYVTGDMAGFVNAFSYTLGGSVSAETPVISTAPGTYTPTLSLSGTTLVMALPSGSSIAYYTAPTPGTVWTLAGSLTPPRYIAENTENGPTYVTATAGVNGTTTIPSIGYLWTNSGGQMRFSTMDVTPVAVKVTLSLTEYVAHSTGATQTGKVSASNYYTISYWACTPSCAAATLTTVEYTSSTGAALTISNVASQTAVSISGATSASSPASEEWCLNQSCAATVFGASDGITTSWYYFDLLAQPTYYTVVGGGTPVAPTLVYSGAPVASGSSQTPGTFTATMAGASVTYLMLRNSTDSANAAIAGQPNEQWAASGAVGDTTSWTITKADQVTADIVYYHQYQNTFTFNLASYAGAPTSFGSSTQFNLATTTYGVALNVAFKQSTAGSITATLWTDAGATVTFPQLAAAVTLSGSQWIDSTGLASTTVAISSGGQPVFSQTYYEQSSESLYYKTQDGSVPSTVPQLTYTTLGVSTHYTLTTTSVVKYIDWGTTATIVQHFNGGVGERWITPTASWTISCTNTVSGCTTSMSAPITYYHQFQQQVSYTTNDGVAMTSIPVFSYTNNGTVNSYTLTALAHLLYVDAGTTATIPGVGTGAVAGEICVGVCSTATQQWVTSPASWTIPTTSGTKVVDSGTSGAIPFSHQYLITFAVSPSSTGSMSPTAGTSVWETTVTPFSIIASAAVNYGFSGWTASSVSITVTSAASASTTASVTGAGTITANFILQSGLQFVETGLNLNGPIWSVMITADPANTCPGTGGPLPCTLASTTSAIFLPGLPVGTYSYTVASPQPWATGIQYIVSFVTNGNPGSVSVNPSASVGITFTPQYLLTTSVVPLAAGTVTANTVNCAITSCWFASGTSITLVATATAPGAAFSSWTSLPSCTPNCSTATITYIMPATPETATANFNVPISISLSPASESAGLGSTVVSTVTVTGGTGTITLSNSAAGSGIGVAFTPLTFAASGVGATSTMTVTISPNAQFGVYTWNVIATDSGAHQASASFQLVVITPTVTTIGFTTSAYAITYGSQSALFFASGHWFVVYSDGTNLIYRYSTDATGTDWNSPSIIAKGVTEGYSFGVGSWQANGITYVALALMTSSYTGGFYYVQGTIGASGISWAACPSQCTSGAQWPVPMQQLTITPALAPTLTAEGSPDLFVDTSSACSTNIDGACIWVTVPALDSNLMWHVEVFSLTSSWSGPSGSSASTQVARDDVLLNTVYSGQDSQVHSELYSMPDAVAAIFVVGNTPDLPHITVFTHGDAFVGTFCVGGIYAGACPAPPVSWTGIQIYEQQSQGAVLPSAAGTDVIFFAALATNGTPGADVQFYSFNYNSVTQMGAFSAPATLGITTIPANAVVNHSWHLSMTFGGTSLYLAYGVDDSLAFEVGTVGSGPSYPVTWSIPIDVPGVTGLVGGVTVAYSGSTVGLVWVQTSGTQYVVKFAVI